jgi:hypothetical protein
MLQASSSRGAGAANGKAKNFPRGDWTRISRDSLSGKSPKRVESIMQAAIKPDTAKFRKSALMLGVPQGQFESELLLSRLCWRWAKHTGHQGHRKIHSGHALRPRHKVFPHLIDVGLPDCCGPLTIRGPGSLRGPFCPSRRWRSHTDMQVGTPEASPRLGSQAIATPWPAAPERGQ